MTVEELEQLAKQMLSKKRFDHTMAVKKQAELLCDAFGADKNKCIVASLLHDITKELKFDNQLQMLHKSDIIVDNIILGSPPLYHAVTAAVYAEQELKITDPELLRAVRYHTTGRADMSNVEKIVYIADATSADRNYKGVERFRELSFMDLDRCLLELLKSMLRSLVKEECLIPSDTLNCYNQLCLKSEG